MVSLPEENAIISPHILSMIRQLPNQSKHGGGGKSYGHIHIPPMPVLYQEQVAQRSYQDG